MGRRKRAFEYTDAEKKSIVNAYFNSNSDIDTFADEHNIPSGVLQFWIDKNASVPSNMLKSIYLSVFYDYDKHTITGVYTEKSFFDKKHIPDETTDPYINGIMREFFTDNVLRPEYYKRIQFSSDTPQYVIDASIRDMIAETGIMVFMEQSVISSEFMCKAAMYLIDSNPANFRSPRLSMKTGTPYPLKQTYLRLKPCHDWNRPNCRQTYIMILCIDKELFDTTGQILPDKELHTRLAPFLDGYILKEEYTPRHYKDYQDSVKFWGESMMDYFNVHITDYMENYMVALLRTLQIDAITTNEDLNQRFILPASA